MIEDVLNSSDATKKAAYESLEAIINKKKDVGKAAFRELQKANFIGEEILLGVYEHSDDVPVAGIITEVTEDWLKYKPYKLDEVIKTTTKKVYGKDREVQVKFWNKKQFGKERMLKKFRGNAPYRTSYFDVRAKENNMKKFNFVPADNGFSSMFKKVDKKGCWYYESEILTGRFPEEGGGCFIPKKLNSITLFSKVFLYMNTLSVKLIIIISYLLPNLLLFVGPRQCLLFFHFPNRFGNAPILFEPAH